MRRGLEVETWCGQWTEPRLVAHRGTCFIPASPVPVRAPTRRRQG
jgi:hypothetical protein